LHYSPTDHLLYTLSLHDALPILPVIEQVSERHVAPLEGGMSWRSNFAWALSGNVVYAACQWGMVIALAKLGNSFMVGQFSLGLADRKSTRLNSSHVSISYAVFCL